MLCNFCSGRHAVARNQPQHNRQSGKHRDKVGGDGIAVFGSNVPCKQTHAGPDGDQTEDPLTQGITESPAYYSYHNSFHAAEGKNALTTVEDPEWDEVERVEPRAGARQGRP